MHGETILQAVNILFQGMIGIFVVLGLIALLVLLMQRIDNGKKK